MGLPFIQRSEHPSEGALGSEELCRIVVVDDSELLLELVSVVLTERGAGIDSARSASEARSLIDEKPPDLVLTDLQMPGGSGIELLDWLRRRHPRVPGLLMTASPEHVPPDWIPRLIEKPFCFDELWGRILESLDGEDSAVAPGE